MKKLFIPGPVHVDQSVLQELARYPIGHRTETFRDLYAEIQSGLKEVLMTSGHVVLSTSSATGLMEASVRNLTRKRVANFICGAFSKRMADITRACGLPQDDFNVEWGRATKPEHVAQALETGEYDVVTVVHNETSTGVMNPLLEIAKVVREYPDVLLVVDAVSSMMGAPIHVDDWGLDVVLASVQKAWALPPGFAIATLSEAAVERAKEVPQSQRGFYFDFERMVTAGAKKQTPITPSIPHMYALRRQLERIRVEGLEARWERHRKMAQQVRNWGAESFGLFPEPGAESVTLTCFTNNAGIDLVKLVERIQNRGYLISGGYGDLKGKTFRLAHMGDLFPKDIDEVLAIIDEEAEWLA